MNYLRKCDIAKNVSLVVDVSSFNNILFVFIMILNAIYHLEHDFFIFNSKKLIFFFCTKKNFSKLSLYLPFNIENSHVGIEKKSLIKMYFLVLSIKERQIILAKFDI
ncbi:hypothetical protein EDEG_02127 [Edhazardia aedis USNM 41457]|uniref:Uncharacterized protein n=1 Tax=Edhazardia aedis (strain USNM 41457) TaxID=1003232 RepID=J8ZV79_EDHAE|nr:hypothetical protein EDEG_02127 [Edhazardia aedis USNM 41457]|eukprot:EJW03543.1 hypothetical protein EDEG_02127 [Edhazardia aedis USNM 41457]